MSITGTIAGPSSYSDLSGLEKLRSESRETPGEALDEVARQFEGMFLKMVLKSMRKAQLSEGMFSNSAVQMHQEMYDSEIVQQMTRGDGLGFSKSLRTQLGAVAGIDKSDSAELPINALNLSSRPFAVSPTHSNPTASSSVVSSSVQNTTNPVLPTPKLHGPATIQDGPFSTPEDFVKTLWPAAKQIAPSLGVKPEVLIAQAAHETGWGKFIPQHENGQSSHNLFGIKTGSQWSGERISKDTLEVVNGVTHKQRADFRAYDSFESSFKDYSQLVSGKSRYALAINNASSAQGYLQGLQDGGYATDPHYADRIMTLLKGSRFQNALSQAQAPTVNETAAISPALNEVKS